MQNENPIRARRSRQKGSRLPENTVCVNRPNKNNLGKWGSPFPTGVTPKDSYEVKHAKHTKSVELFCLWIETTDEGQAMAAMAMRELRGKNLACYCPHDLPCHGEILLAIANYEE